MAPLSGVFSTSPMTTETQWSQVMRNAWTDGVAGGYSTPGLNVTPGSGLTVNVAPGTAYGLGWYFVESAVTNLTLPAATTNPRVHTVVLRASVSSHSVTLVVLPGSENASPVPPNLTRTDLVTWDVPVADVRVDVGVSSVTTAKITDRRRFTGVKIIPVNDRADIFAAERYAGMILDEKSSGSLLRWDGAGFKRLTSTKVLTSGSLNVTVPAGAAGIYSGVKSYDENVVFSGAPTIVCTPLAVSSGATLSECYPANITGNGFQVRLTNPTTHIYDGTIGYMARGIPA